MTEPSVWKDRLERILGSLQGHNPTELINAIRDLGIAMGHDAGEGLLDAHPELFSYRPALTAAFGKMVQAQDTAEIRQMLDQDLDGPASFGRIAAGKNKHRRAVIKGCL